MSTFYNLTSPKDGNKSSQFFSRKKDLLSLLAAVVFLLMGNTTYAQQLSLTVSNVQHVQCHGDADGEIAVTASGGLSPYTYEWNDGVIFATRTGLSAGEYKVTVTDANNDEASVDVTITQPDAISLSVTSTNAACFGGNGDILVTISGGTPPYNLSGTAVTGTAILLDNPPYEATISASAGPYSVVITDDNLCTESESVMITQPNSPISISIRPEDATCASGNGSIVVTVSGGIPPYEWKIAGATTAPMSLDGVGPPPYVGTVTALAGSHQVEVIDNDGNGCSALSAFAAITEPPAISLLVDTIGATCFGGNGVISVTISGGTPGASGYQWGVPDTLISLSTSPYQGTLSVSPGTYQVTVTDGNQCLGSEDNVMITEPDDISLSATSEINCVPEGGAGVISFDVSGGTPPYQWSVGSITMSTTSLSAPPPYEITVSALPSAVPYQVTVTDDNGCVVKSNLVTIAEPLSLSVSADNCVSGGSGVISVTVSGGRPPYQWQVVNVSTATTTLNAPPYKGTASAPPGTYQVEVRDANNCLSLESVTVTEPLSVSLGFEEITCRSANDNSVSLYVTVSGGTPPYQLTQGGLLWQDPDLDNDPYETTSSNTFLLGFTYQATVTDAQGCVVKSLVTPTAPDQITIVATPIDPTDCASDGIIEVTVSGGVPPYQWGVSGTTMSLSTSPYEGTVSVSPGTYQMTITDSLGCAKSEPVAITAPNGVSFTTTVTDATCPSSADGVIEVMVSGGTPNYQWRVVGLSPGWEILDTSPYVGSISAPPGTYQIEIQDDQGACTNSGMVTVLPDPITAVETINHVSCAGGSDGSVSIVVSGGTGRYNYSWSDGGATIISTGSDIGRVTAGGYTVTVTDDNNCMEIFSYTLNEPAALTVDGTVNNVSCHGAGDGSVYLTVSGGTAPYTYDWPDTPDDVPSASGLGPTSSTKTVYIEDANGCDVTFTYNITQPAAQLTVSTSSTSNVSCFGGNDGSLTLAVSGGTPPYSYSWNTGATTQALANLMAATYQATVTDANDCTQPFALAITQPSSLVATPQIINATACAASDGSISLTISGGAPDYTYVWDDGQSGMLSSPYVISRSNLNQGTYQVTIGDNGGCQQAFPYTITEPEDITISLDVTHADCFGAGTGSIDVAVSGGIPPYTYSWNAGQISSPTNLTAGQYQLVVTDFEGCTESSTVTINQPDDLAATAEANSITCYAAGNDGSIGITVSGGTPGYTYAWDNGLSAGTSHSNLSVGTYQVSVTDGNGCEKDFSYTITRPPALAVNEGSVTGVSCFGDSDGAFTLNVSGGTPPYTYEWRSTSTGSTTDALATTIITPGGSHDVTLTNGMAGGYDVVVTDDNNCTAEVLGVSISEPDELNLLVNEEHNCSNGNYEPFFEIEWSGGTPDPGNALSEGYTLSITHPNGTVKDTAVLSPFTYSTTMPGGLPTGTYGFTITDNNGCSTSTSLDIMPLSSISVTRDSVMNSCNPGADGAVWLTVSGGYGEYTYTWSNGETTRDVSGLAAGIYNVQIADGCNTITEYYTISQPSAALEVANPAPVDVTCHGGMDGGVGSGGTSGGTPPYTYLWSTGAITPSLQNVPAGTYSLTVTDSRDCERVYANIIINEPDAITVVNDAANKLDLDCNGDNQAFVSVTASGGTGILSYMWDNGVAGQSISAVPGGVYTLNVTDENGCSESFSYTITEPDILTSTASTTDVNCSGGNDGALVLAVSGGTPPYTYLWNTGDITSALTNLTAGQYHVVVSDARGCQYTDSYNVSEPSALVVTDTTIINTVCSNIPEAENFVANGSISVIVSGGESPYTYLWPSGATTSADSNLYPGPITLTITDDHGCILKETYMVGEPDVQVDVDIVNNTACTNGTAGEIHITLSGGAAPYAYSWTGPNGGSISNVTTDLTSLATGTYVLTVEDDVGCAYEFSFFVGEGSNPVTTVVGSTDLSCFEADDGSIDIELSSGTGTYNVTVRDGSANTVYNSLVTTTPATINVSGLEADTYTVSALDANGCQAAGAVVVVDQPEQLAISMTTTIATCYGFADGTITASAEGGTPPYDFFWNDAAATTHSGVAEQVTRQLTGLTAGTYSITVIDGNGCKKIQQAVVGEEPSVDIVFTSDANDIVCYYDETGSVVATITGGSGTSFSYEWYSGQHPDTVPLGQSGMATNGIAQAVNLGIGDYTIKVTDETSGCISYEVFHETVGINALNIAIAYELREPCNTGVDTTASFTVSGGTPGYTYTVTGPSFSSTGSVLQDSTVYLTDLVAGSYTVSVTDAQGCSAQEEFDIGGLFAEVETDSVYYCPGGFNGVATVTTVSGGTPPYTYVWSNNGGTILGTGHSLNSQPAGTYTVTISDALGYCKIMSMDIYEPDSVLGVNDAVVTDEQCANHLMGRIDVTPGGTAPHLYSWSSGTSYDPNSVISTDQDLEGVGPGDYTVRITDTYGCVGEQTYTIGLVATITLNTSKVDVLCKGDATGAIDITVAGNGMPPYSYTWTNGATTEDLGGLTAGSYGLTVTDADGCTVSGSWEVTEPFSNLVASVLGFTDANCFGGNDGTADIYAVGGVLPYTYSWSNGSTVEDPLDLSAGVHQVMVTDANGCSLGLVVTITEPDAPLTSSLSVDHICYEEDNTGAIDLSVSGGTPSYSYSWTSDNTAFSGASTQDLSDIPEGTYQVVITDANGCDNTISGIVVDKNTELIATRQVVHVDCFGESTGSISVAMSGGTPPYSFAWSHGAATQIVQNLPVGTYWLTVTDAIGCTRTFEMIITGPSAALTAIITSLQDVHTCFGDNTGLIDIGVSGGTSPYSFAWSHGETTQNVQDLFAGGYQVTVTDANGCQTFIKGAVIGQPSQLLANLVKLTDVDCNGASTGSIDIDPNGGTAPYTFAWSNGANTEDLSNLSVGGYQVTVTDANGCVATASFMLSGPDVLSVAIDAVGNVDCNGGSDGSVMTTITGGATPYTIAWSDGIVGTEDRTNLPAGIYVVNVTDDCGAMASVSATITEPDAITVLTTVTDVDCFGASTGMIDITVTGGAPPYDFLWNNLSISEDQMNLSVGTYSVIVTDANGCTHTASMMVNEPAAPISATASVTDVACFGNSTGAIDIAVAGGTSPYTFAWSNGDNTEDLSNVQAGSYTVAVTDAAGCTFNATFAVAEPVSSLTASTNTTDVDCFGASSGAIDLGVTGGTAPYSYSWNTGDNTQDLSNIPAGSYTCMITDDNGCTLSITEMVNEPASGIAATTTITNVSCNGGNDGAVDVTVTGGTPPYGYLWNNGFIGQDLVSIGAGPYSCAITDANGCTFALSVTIGEPTPLLSSMIVTDVDCFGDLTGTVDLTVTGGTAPYTYSWSNGDITQDLLNVSAGTYNVAVTDDNGCTINVSATIAQNAAISTSIIQQDASCFGATNGSASLNVNGGIPPYSFLWSTGATTQNISGLAAGVYDVVVTDALGCNVQNQVNIAEPAELIANPTAGPAPNELTANVTGGTPPYSYVWSSNPPQYTEIATSLAYGTYTVVVTDANGCSATGTGQTTNVGIEERSFAQHITLYPNPTADEVFIGYDFTSEVDLEVTMMNHLGQLVRTTSEPNAVNGQLRLDISDLASGVYNVVISNGRHTDSRRLVVIRK